MAYVVQSQEEEEAARQAAGNPLLAGFGAGPAASSGLAAPAAPQQPSSGFVPYSAYSGANAGGARKMASDVASDVGRTAQTAQGGISGAQQQFREQVTAGNPFAPPTPAASMAGWFGGGAQLGQQPVTPRQAVTATTPARAAPIAPVTDPIEVLYTGKRPDPPGTITPDEARKRAAQSYTGPTAIENLADWKTAAAQTHAAQDQLGATATDVGRQALGQKKYGTAGGNSRLDAALMGSAGSRDFDALRAKYGDLVGEQKRVSDSANAYAGATKTGAEGIAKQYGDNVRDYDAAEEVRTEAQVAIQPTVDAAKARGEWPPRTPEAVNIAISAVASIKPPLGAIAAAAMRALIEAELAAERNAIENKDSLNGGVFEGGSSTATIKTSGTKLPGTR